MSPNATQVIVISAVFNTLASAVVALRFYARRIKRIALGVDDWTILVGLVLAWLLSILLIVGSSIGALGGHTLIDSKSGSDVVDTNTANAGKIYYASFCIMSLAFGIIKISAVLLYQRIFVGQLFKLWSNGLLILIGSWMVAFFFSLVLFCGIHPAASWTSPEFIIKYCVNTNDLELSFAITDAITDILVIITPIPIILKLQLSFSRRIAITGIFLLGLLSTVASITRMTFVIIDIYDTSLGFRDFLGLVTNVDIWAELEICVAVIAACLPTLRPLFGSIHPKNQRGRIGAAEEDGIHLQSKTQQNISPIATKIPGSNSANATAVDRISVTSDLGLGLG